ncbi:MAG: Ig-like domain-containing protein, partial [Planctomycetota bacterium]
MSFELTAGSDTGSSSVDCITSDNTPTYEVSVEAAGQIGLDYDGDATSDESRHVDTAGPHSFPSSPLADDTYEVQA